MVCEACHDVKLVPLKKCKGKFCPTCTTGES
ncbi:hypothetical protein [Enterococcus diestrammenae]|nr:hypothetical protein [Enterococcus diestrammenae]